MLKDNLRFDQCEKLIKNKGNGLLEQYYEI